MVETTAPRSATSTVALYALIALILTSLHHAYGAYVYATPWRLHVAFIASATALVILAALAVLRAHPEGWLGTAAWWLFALTVLIVPILFLGVFEGFYNHVLKNALFFAGLPTREMVRFFPPPKYELPNDAFFEITGVLQVVPAALAAVKLYRLARSRRAARSTRQLTPSASAAGR
jgi:hypothetical protein